MVNYQLSILLIQDTFANNLFILLLVAYLIGICYLCSIQWVKYKYSAVHNLLHKWKRSVNDYFVSLILQIVMYSYPQLIISTIVEMLLFQWLFPLAVIVFVSFICYYSSQSEGYTCYFASYLELLFPTLQ
jgi:hypothetical protein